jgi:hypothetical protein
MALKLGQNWKLFMENNKSRTINQNDLLNNYSKNNTKWLNHTDKR